MIGLLSQPDLALPLLLAGVFLIYAEFNRPGTVFLGSLGALSVMLAIFGLTQNTLSLPALAITLSGLAILLAELRFPTRNVLALTGTATLALGLARLNPGIHLATALATAISFATITLWLGRIALQARRNKFAPGSMPWQTKPTETAPQGRLNQ